jgi:ribosomal protein L16 Arg81 hydroxylase
MLLDDLLQGFPRATFMKEHYLRSPFARRATAERLRGMATWSLVDWLIEKTPCDLLIVKSGTLWPGERPTSARQARALYEEGHTLALRQPDRHHPGLAELARTFSAEFHGRINLHIYCTPAGHHGFDWHCDPEEVFIFQTVGRKDYFLRENTLAPQPLLEALPNGALAGREVTPIQECQLTAGDWLYIPGGYWHRAQAPEEALSLSIGLMPPTLLEVLDYVRAGLARSPAWRRRLPALGHASELDDAQKQEVCHALFAELGSELQRALADPALPLRFLAHTAQANLRASALEERSSIPQPPRPAPSVEAPPGRPPPEP